LGENQLIDSTLAKERDFIAWRASLASSKRNTDAQLRNRVAGEPGASNGSVPSPW
jgi:hypothetical protein